MHCESRSPGRYTMYLLNRQVYLDRWRGVLEPRDDVRLWAACGYRVLDHEVIRKNDLVKRHLVVPAPGSSGSGVCVDESPKGLRWAIKNPAPYGPESERWGDTHFARAVAAALRGLGQEVVIDHRAEFERTTSRHDDVSLVLRGLAPFSPSAEQVSIAWSSRTPRCSVVPKPRPTTGSWPRACAGRSRRAGRGGSTSSRSCRRPIPSCSTRTARSPTPAIR